MRAALAKVELGEGDAAFVYRTDALDSDDVREVELPREAATVAATTRPCRSASEPWPRQLRGLAGRRRRPAPSCEAAGFEVGP